MAEPLSHPVRASLGVGSGRMRRVARDPVLEVLAEKTRQLLKSCEL